MSLKFKMDFKEEQLVKAILKIYNDNNKGYHFSKESMDKDIAWAVRCYNNLAKENK